MALWLSGGQWVILQVTAWSGMIITRTIERGMGEALSSTFDGQHPCKFCHAIKKAQQGEQRSEFPSPMKVQGKMFPEVALLHGSFLLTPPHGVLQRMSQDTSPALIPVPGEPLVPPPRVLS